MKKFCKLFQKKLLITILSVVLVAVFGSASLIYASVSASQRTVTIKTGSVIKDDFAGIGVNSLPFALMNNNRAKGSNEAYWELEKSRILNLKPSIARLWMQVDWFVTENDLINGTGEDYLHGRYDFESANMQAVYKYLDTYKQIGSQVILVTNWKVGSLIQPWFSIDGINTPENSAPADIDAYAKAHTALLEYLINNKGYENITYVSVANEPDLTDFESHGDQYVYYQDTAKALADELSKAKSKVKMLGFECGSSYFTSMDYLYRSFKDNPSYFNEYALHCYQKLSDAIPYMRTVKNSLPKGKSIWLTEFNANAKDFGYSPSGLMSTAANLGYNGALYWMTNDVYGEDPLDPDDKNIGGATGLWNKPYEDLKVKESYYELALWLRYVKPHSKVLESSVSNEKDMRSTVFFDGKDYTVIVENSTKSAQKLTLSFDKNINKTFYKHVYSYESITPETQGVIPASVKSFKVTNKLEDNSVVNNKRTVTVYTTLPDVTQVTFKSDVSEVASGASVQLNAAAANGAAINWSVVSGGGSVNSTGKYTATNTYKDDTVAIKAQISSGEYAIAVIKIK